MRPPTPRELEVLAAVLEEGSEKAAAYRLGMSKETVSAHLEHVRRKVGAVNTTQAVWRCRNELEGSQRQLGPETPTRS